MLKEGVSQENHLFLFALFKNIMFEEKIQIKVYKKPGAIEPQRATREAGALDVYTCLPPDTIITIPPFKRMLIPTGLFIEIPKGYFISIRARSGLALKQGLILPNAPATIDSDYRGELQILVGNIDKEKSIQIQHNERIAQMLLEKIVYFDWLEVENTDVFTRTTRDAGGFGSTGLV